MGKSIRSKIKRKFRTIKRVNVDPFVTEKLKEIQEESPLTVRAEETPESAARRNDPRKKRHAAGVCCVRAGFPWGEDERSSEEGGRGEPAVVPADREGDGEGGAEGGMGRGGPCEGGAGEGGADGCRGEAQEEDPEEEEVPHLLQAQQHLSVLPCEGGAEEG
mmetsp:Transcript_27692/g.68463  ORF Transcript_27692/g.68463 Transcript_27692/m.68463 type:complete len:162 (+) Transcript_27692:132-617(+)